MLAASLCGCFATSLLPLRSDDAINHAEFYALAIDATPATREALWRAWRTGERTPDTRLRTALLQSLPDHAGYDPQAAAQTLGVLKSKQDTPLDVAVMARVRLAELESANACREEVQSLKRRMAKIADIERQLDRNGR